jgi:hypothetical protein
VTACSTRWRPRRILRVLHRDIGYLLFFITALYTISGVAVNHIHDWNPNYEVTRTSLAIGPLQSTDLDAMEAEVVAKAGLDPSMVTGRHRPSEDEFALFLPEGGEARINVLTGEGQLETFEVRPVIFATNVLHLNKLKGAWTYVADAFAVLLFFLAASGLFMLKGRAGLLGRGKWLVAIGTLIPLAFLVSFFAAR